jgi:hypothetical protein
MTTKHMTQIQDLENLLAMTLQNRKCCRCGSDVGSTEGMSWINIRCRVSGTNSKTTPKTVGLLDGIMHAWTFLYRATRIKTLCMERSHWNQ